MKKLKITISGSTSGSISSKQTALYNEYVRNYAQLLMFQNGWNAGVPNGAHILYRYDGNIGKRTTYTKDIREIIDTKKSRKVDLEAYTVELGGVFLKTGGDDEIVGGESQKLG